MEYVVSYKQSDTLLQLEDEGQLLVLNDLICKVFHAGATVNVPISAVSDGNTHATPSHSPSTTIQHTTSQPHFDPNNTVMPTQPHATTHTSTTTQSLEELRQVYEELGEKLRRHEVRVTLYTTDGNGETSSTEGPLLFAAQGFQSTWWSGWRSELRFNLQQYQQANR